MKEMTSIFVAHGRAVDAVSRIRSASEMMPRTETIDLTDATQKPRFTAEKKQKMESAFSNLNAVLVLGVSEWTNVGIDGYSEENPGDSDALYYASGGHTYGMRRLGAVGTCIVTDSLDDLDPILALKKDNFEKSYGVRIVVVYKQNGGHMGREVFDSLIRRFPNLHPINFLCFNSLDDKAARLIAKRIRNLV